MAALLFASGHANALSPSRAITQYAHDVWTSRDGLPEGAVLSIRQTADGYLWLGTQCCLVRYDGVHFVRYESGQLGLKQHSFGRDLLETPDHSLWAGLVGGMARYRDGRFEWFDEQQGLLHPFVYALAPGPNGLVWVGTGGAGVWGFADGRFSPHPAYVADPQLPAKVNDLATDTDGVLWAASDEGVLSLGTTVRKFQTGDGLPSNLVNVLLTDHEHNLWAGTREGLARSTSSHEGHFHASEDTGRANVTALLEDREHNIWIGSHGGLFRETDEEVQGVVEDRGGVFALAEDAQGALWVGTGEGLERYRDGVFATVGFKEGLSEPQILGVHTRRAGGVWVLDARGAIWIDQDGQRTDVAQPGSVTGDGMLGLAEGADGSLWVANRDLMRLHDGAWTHYSHEGGGFSVVQEDGDGLLVAQTAIDGKSTVSSFHDGLFVALPVAAPLSFVQRIYRDRSRQVWISTGGGGLVRLGHGETRIFRSSDGLPHDVVYGLAEDDNGSLWVATRGGLARIRGDAVVSFAGASAVPTQSPVQLYVDGLGHLWVTADDGVHRLNLRDLNRYADDRTDNIEAQTFTSHDGLRSTEISWRCSAQAVTVDGCLYYATARGLAVVDPRSLKRDTTTPLVRIESASSAGRRIDPDERTLLLPNPSARLEIRYSTPALSDPGNIEFRYRLAGFEKAWIRAGASRTANYTNLPTGEYDFEVSARRIGGDWGASTPALHVTAPPRWYETFVTRLFAGLALGFTVWGSHRLQLARQRRNEKQLASKVLERTEELRREVLERQAAEARTRELADELEARVTQRTAELELANLSARKSAERYALAVRGAEDGLWDWDLSTGVLYLSPRWKAMLGYADYDLPSSLDGWLSRVHPDDVAAFRHAFEPRIDHSGQIRCEYRMRTRDGVELWVLCRGIMLFDGERNAIRAAGSQTDITPRKLSEAALLRNATHDALTGLPNRSLFSDRLEQAVLRARHHQGGACAVLFLNLDHFKTVNDTFGHAAGDRILVELATRLRAAVRDTETAARLGGDEFAVLLPEIPDDSYATQTAEHIQRLFSAPIELSGHRVTVAASIGVKIGRWGQDQLGDFMRDADAAMYRAKEEGRGRKRVFSTRLRDEVRERQRTESGLRLALERGEFELHYQPLVSLNSGMAVSVEALIRWREPERGLIAPGLFIPIAEACGLILPISEWVLQAACAQARVWEHELRRAMPIAINVPPALLNDAGLASKIETELRRHGLPGEALSVEIVETSVLETQASVLSNLNRLQELGVKIAIDDFGTGYSSFAYLKRLPISYLKIDRSLSQNVPNDPTDTAICKAIASMGAQLGLGIVAEGVETKDQADFLRQSGCGIAQGYYFSRPLPAAECTTWLQQSGALGRSLLAV